MNSALKAGGRSGMSGAGTHRIRATLVMAEVALAVVALIGAGLFTRSFRNAQRIHPGFESSNVLLGRFFLHTTSYSPDDVKRFSATLKQRLESSPAVRSATFTDFVPLSTTAGPYSTVGVDGYTPAEGERMTVNRALIDRGYFETLGIPLTEGRTFDERDRPASAPVIIVNSTFARRYFRGGPAIGQRVRTMGHWRTVVGVARDSKYFSPAEPPQPFFYLPFRQEYQGSFEIYALIATVGRPENAIPLLRRAVNDVDPNAAGFHPVTLPEYTQVALFGQRIAASLMGTLGMMCLVLAAVGLYSVMSYAVSQRTQEIGVRMAMGARPRDVARMVIAQGLRWTLCGLAAGSAIALAVMRLAGGMLVRVETDDPLTFGMVAVFLAAVAVIATWIPAIRATHVDPLIALRRE